MFFLIYVVKTNDKRLYFLSELLQKKRKVLYSNSPTDLPIKEIVLPLEGIDEFGYVKHTTLRLIDLLKDNKVKKVYVGYVSNLLRGLAIKFNFIIISFYQSDLFNRKNLNIKLNILRYLILEKEEKEIDNFRFLIMGNDQNSQCVANELKAELIDNVGLIDWNKYDAIINLCNPSVLNCNNPGNWQNILVIEMINYPYGVDILYFYEKKIKYLLMDQLQKQYMTKSGAQIMYDCMVNYNDSL